MDNDESLKKALKARLANEIPSSPTTPIRNTRSKKFLIYITLFILLGVISYQLYTNASCNIKGNINQDGQKLYFPPEHPSYDRVEIDPNKGEFYFCTEFQAVKAGWDYVGD